MEILIGFVIGISLGAILSANDEGKFTLPWTLIFFFSLLTAGAMTFSHYL